MARNILVFMTLLLVMYGCDSSVEPGAKSASSGLDPTSLLAEDAGITELADTVADPSVEPFPQILDAEMEDDADVADSFGELEDVEIVSESLPDVPILIVDTQNPDSDSSEGDAAADTGAGVEVSEDVVEPDGEVGATGGESGGGSEGGGSESWCNDDSDCPEESVCLESGSCSCVPECGESACGPDGCGGLCGDCGDLFCVEGLCVEECSAQCTDVECGADGCGGFCGNCGETTVCNDQGFCAEECGSCPGTPSCWASSFESGTTDGWVIEGSQLLQSFGEAGPTDGDFMLAISSGGTLQLDDELFVESSSAKFSTCLPETSVVLSLDWKFYSEEFLEWCGSFYQDSFELSIISGGSQTSLVEIRIDDLCPPEACQGCGEIFLGLEPSDVQLDQGDTYKTSWVNSKVGLGSQWSGQPITLKLEAKDAGDSIYDTVILLDHLQFEYCTPDCQGKSCGSDGCGGSCGSCDSGQVCVDGAVCCVPSCDNAECGSDGCGGSCGECGAMALCDGGGQCQSTCGNGVCDMDQGEDCELCPFDCSMSQCSGPDCGPGYSPTCSGTCDYSFWLGDGFCDAQFNCSETFWDLGDCQACVPDCDGKVCGKDGCGGVCGTCPDFGVCDDDGSCSSCVPECTEKECGSDGCGGLCGSCKSGFTCGPIGDCSPGGCSIAIGPGCNGCPCEACVCGVDSFCCDTMWDPICVALCISDCGACPDADLDYLDTPTDCVPDCDGKSCGPDQCGGSCGVCGENEACLASQGICLFLD